LFVVLNGGVVECQSFGGVHDCCWLKRQNVVCFGFVCVVCLKVGEENGKGRCESNKYLEKAGKL